MRGYDADRARVARLQHDILALERRADCIAPADLARRLQALLDQTGWTAWRGWLRLTAVQDGRRLVVAPLRRG